MTHSETTGKKQMTPFVDSGAEMNLVPNGPGAPKSRPAGEYARPAAPFLAQIIGARVAGNRLARARSKAPEIMNAYSDAGALAPSAPRSLDRSL